MGWYMQSSINPRVIVVIIICILFIPAQASLQPLVYVVIAVDTEPARPLPWVFEQKLDFSCFDRTDPKAPVAEKAPPAKPGRKLPGWAKGAIPVGALALVVISLFAFGVIDLNGKSSAPPASESSASDSPSDSSSQGFGEAVGSWESIDGGDGSYQTLWISSLYNNRFQVTFHDDAATACGTDDDGNPLVGAEFTAIGETQDMSLSIDEVEIFCLSTPRESNGIAEFYVRYSPNTDTLTDQYGDTWERIR